MRKPSPQPRRRPVGKLDRMTKQSVRRLWSLLYRATRRQSKLLERYEERVDALTRRVERANAEARAAHRMAAEALALYYDTHDTISGEHINGGVLDEGELTEEVSGVGENARGDAERF